MKTIVGRYAGERQMSQYWADTRLPLVVVDGPKPKFHESGWASGHAAEELEVPGLSVEIKRLAKLPGNKSHINFSDASEIGWCWSLMEFTNAVCPVFLQHVYDGRKDVYHMSN